MTNTKHRTKRSSHGQPLRQVAALAYRWSDDLVLEVLVLSSRETHRPVIPKGWPIKGRKEWTAAKIEARQEAGVIGEISRKPIGHYKYWKRLEAHFALVKVAVYPLEVHRQLDDWPERHERAQAWLPADQAAILLEEPELSALVADFARQEAGRKMAHSASPQKRARGNVSTTA